MPTYDWKPFLLQLSRDILADDDLRSMLPPSVVESGWLGYPGATEPELAELETRLGISLPTSYREFLSVTNGWHNISPFIYKLWSTSEIDWLRVRNQQAIDGWIEGEKYTEKRYGPTVVTDEEYFVYGEEQPSEAFRSQYLQTALEISDWGDGILLLNPQVVFPNGEWEAWFHAYWLPGASRYRSFWELIHEEHKSFLNMRGRGGSG